MLENIVRPELGKMKVVDLRHPDIDRLHRKISERAPYRANRVAAVLSKMLSFAVKLERREENPVRGLDRNPEERRYRYLAYDELRRLTEALANHSSRDAANAVRLLLLTGARRGEVLSATWDQFDLAVGVWTKPSSHTKQKREHRVPLSATARQLLADMRADAGRRGEASPICSRPALARGRLAISRNLGRRCARRPGSTASGCTIYAIPAQAFLPARDCRRRDRDRGQGDRASDPLHGRSDPPGTADLL